MLAQHIPRDVGPQLFATHIAVCFALDQRAVLGGNAMTHPRLHGLVSLDAKPLCRAYRTAKEPDSSRGRGFGGHGVHWPLQDSLAILDDLALDCKRAHEKLALMSIHDQIKLARTRKSWSMEQLAAAVSEAEKLAKPLSWQTVQQWEAGKSAPKRSRMKTVARLLDLDVGELVDADRAVVTVEDGEDAEAEYLPGFEQISIPKLANAGSMGGGVDELHDDVVVGRLTLSPQWVTRTLTPITKIQNLRFIHGYGDSMEPTFNDGDILLVDSGVPAVKVDGIYVLEANDRIYIKRVRQRMDGSYEISSDNTNVKTVDVLDGSKPVEVKGRVVWVWNGKKI